MSRYKNKTDTLLYHGNLSPETVAKMKETRGKFIELSSFVEGLGNSREVSAAFTSIEHAQMLAIKHLCMVDEQAILESVA
jgi:hypothetical protein